MPRINEKNQFIWLTFALIGMLVAGAFSRDIPGNRTLQIIQLSSLALLLISLLSLKTDRVLTKRFVVILGFMFVFVVVRATTKIQYFEYLYLVTLLAFMLAAAWMVASQVLLTGSVDANKMVGSVALYLLLGEIWAIFYTILLEFSPQALNGVVAGPWFDNLPTTTYFSFVTLTTLGYGDISPATPIAQVLVMLEAVTGMFYLAIIVASMVGSMRSSGN